MSNNVPCQAKYCVHTCFDIHLFTFPCRHSPLLLLVSVLRSVNEIERIEISVREKPMWQSNMDITEKLATYGSQEEEKHNAICVGHHYTQTNTNNVNKA